MKDFLYLKKEILKKVKFFLHRHPNIFYFLAFFLSTFSIVLLIFLISLSIKKLTPLQDPFSFSKTSDYPILQRQFLPIVTARAAYIVDNSSKVVLFAKDENLRFSPASTTKIMTALVALDYFKLDSLLTIKRSGVEPVIVGFPYGSQVKFEDLLFAMLIPSGNDAALAIADNYPGGEDSFVLKMNEKAKALHLDNTHFADPVGLVDDEDYTTVRDMAILASVAINNPIFAKTVATKEKVITDNLGNIYNLKSTNKLLGLYGVNGIKTGFTGEAGEVLVTSALVHGHTFFIVVMKSDDRFSDTEKLLQLLSENVNYLKLNP